jgi:hypothetical protein
MLNILSKDSLKLQQRNDCGDEQALDDGGDEARMSGGT